MHLRNGAHSRNAVRSISCKHILLYYLRIKQWHKLTQSAVLPQLLVCLIGSVFPFYFLCFVARDACDACVGFVSSATRFPLSISLFKSRGRMSVSIRSLYEPKIQKISIDFFPNSKIVCGVLEIFAPILARTAVSRQVESRLCTFSFACLRYSLYTKQLMLIDVIWALVYGTMLSGYLCTLQLTVAHLIGVLLGMSASGLILLFVLPVSLFIVLTCLARPFAICDPYVRNECTFELFFVQMQMKMQDNRKLSLSLSRSIGPWSVQSSTQNKQKLLYGSVLNSQFHFVLHNALFVFFLLFCCRFRNDFVVVVSVNFDHRRKPTAVIPFYTKCDTYTCIRRQSSSRSTTTTSRVYRCWTKDTRNFLDDSKTTTRRRRKSMANTHGTVTTLLAVGKSIFYVFDFWFNTRNHEAGQCSGGHLTLKLILGDFLPLITSIINIIITIQK